MTTPSPAVKLTELWATPSTWYGRLACVDHKVIGLRYFVTAMTFLLLGGIEALIMRLQLSHADSTVVTAEAFAQLFSMHGNTMMFLFALPVLSGFSNYLWPLLLGARDMALPRINALGFWLFLAGGLFLYSSIPLGLAPDNGWFSYVPLSSSRYLPRSGVDFYTLSLILLGISTTVGAINFLVTFVRMRAPGMSIGRVPILLWGTLTASGVVLFAVPALTAACLLLYLDRQIGTHFYDTSLGGKPLLWQQLFWIFGHPWVYVIVLPAMSMVSQIIPTFSRRPLVAYWGVVGATIAVGMIGFLVWVHHMFATGMDMEVMAAFGAASLVISLPSAVSMFSWIATIWLGRPVIRTPFLFAIGFLVTFVIGGISGVMTASVPFDWQLTDSYFVVAHLHYVLIGINLFPVIGGIYYWFPKVRGRLMHERAGKISFWMMFTGFNLGFFPMHIVGMLGMPRRIYTYSTGLGWDSWNMVITIGAFLLALGLLVTLINVWWSWRHGEVAGNNPWAAATLEWSVASPPPPHNFTFIPHVATREPLWEGPDEPERTVLDAGPVFDDGHQVITTTAHHATVIGAVSMPGPSLAPLYLAAALLVVFESLLWKQWIIAVIGVVLVVAAIAAWLWPDSSKSHALLPVPEDPRPIGLWTMWLTVATEAALFASLFFAWFFLASSSDVWMNHAPPELIRPGINTGILLLSSAVLHWGLRAANGQGLRASSASSTDVRSRSASSTDVRSRRAVIAFTILLGASFLGMQLWEYATLGMSPVTDAYSSIFFTLTGLHGAHVFVGLLMLGFLLLTIGRNPQHTVADRRRVQNVSLYWHFVDVVWLFVFGVVYLLPHVTR